MISLMPFLKSILAGFAMCLPIGPLSVVVIRKTIKYNKLRAFIPGIGSLVADFFYAAMAAFGITYFTELLTNYSKHIQIIAAFILLILAIRILRKPATTSSEKAQGKLPLIKSFSLGFFVALFNPGTFFLMTAILTALHVSANGQLITSFEIISGLMIGEFLWWIFLIHITNWAKKRFGKQAQLKINKIAGSFLIAVSIIIVIKYIFFK